MIIYIPTRGRAHDQVTLSYFPEDMRKDVVLVIDDMRSIYIKTNMIVNLWLYLHL